MPHILLKRFERRVLRPISFAHGALIIVLLVQQHFLITIPLAVLWLLYGTVGQALHKDLSSRQLAWGEHVTSAGGNDLELLSTEDGHRLGKATLGLGLILSVTTIIMGIYLGVRWFFALPLGILAWFLSPILSIVLAGADAFLKAWRKTSDRRGGTLNGRDKLILDATRGARHHNFR